LTSVFSCSSTRWNHSFSKSPLSKLASGILIQELNTGKVVFSHQADQFFMPASNAKLATFLMAHSFLGDSIPSFAYLEKRDTLFFWGTGDPTQLNPSFQNSSLIDYLSKSNKVLVYCAPQKEIPPLGSGWSWDDYNDSYSAEISPLPLYGNLVGFSVKNQQWEMTPRFFESAISGTHSFNYVLRDRLKNEFTLPALKSERKVQQVPFVTSASLTAKLLATTTKRMGGRSEDCRKAALKGEMRGSERVNIESKSERLKFHRSTRKEEVLVTSKNMSCKMAELQEKCQLCSRE
jgi:D-alanyl-D-alanine carboxypeptidase/D-alanyl-D-alanine-endopeptidase (penicillin-binding protein 4)